MTKLTILLFVAVVASALPGDKLNKYCDETHVAKTGRVRRVVGGENAASKEFTHMAALGYEQTVGSKWRCGGSLITDKFVLTSATCINKYVPKIVRLGDLNLSSELDDANAVEAKVARVIKYPGFNDKTMHDIGLVELASPVTFNDFVRPACLNTVKSTTEDQSFVATGWGITSPKNSSNPPLQKVSLQEVPSAECIKLYEKLSSISAEYQLCTRDDKKDTCTGDSGGPLQKPNPKYVSTYDIYAVVSFGSHTCSSASIPSVSARVFPYLDWIESIVFSE